MPASTGMDARTGDILTGWADVEQSIATILTTPIGTRVMRRKFGSELMELIDRPMNDRVILAAYAAVAVAIARWEPRFSLTQCDLIEASAEGVLSIRLGGVYLPRGHLGDNTPATAAEILVALRSTA